MVKNNYPEPPPPPENVSVPGNPGDGAWGLIIVGVVLYFVALCVIKIID